MAEIKWSSEYLFNEAGEIAKSKDEGLSIKHFWAVADRDLAGAAPKSFTELFERARNYIQFDRAIARNAVDKADPDVWASVKRMEIFDAHLAKLKTLDPNLQVTGMLQFMCRTNLLFLGREVFNKAFTFYTHAPICNFFVQKDPSKPHYEQDDIKERLLLYPRGSFKSTLDVIDCVQWMINFPDIRILILAAESGLAVSFIGEMKNYFFVPKSAEPTSFQKLFPEWVINSRTEGAEDQFICPCRTQGDEKKKDPSAWANSILSNLPGWHCDLMKGDDVVNDKNSETKELIAKVIRKINYAESLIDPGGYKDLLGTPYAGSDLYAHTVASVEPADLKKLATPARWLIPASQHKDERDCTDADWELLFEFDKTGRKRLTNDFLNKRKRKDLGIYLSQYMLNASGTRKVKFTMDLLVQRTISLEQLPNQLRYYIFWDFAYGASQSNDYSVGAVIGLDDQNRAYVVEIIRDHFVDSDLARAIVDSYKKYQPRLVCIENSNGAQFLEQTIRRYAEEIGIAYIPLDFFKVDRSVNAKATRIGSTQPYLLGGLLFFMNTIDCLDDLYKEFKDFGTSTHDDIPDAISHFMRVLPAGTPEPNGPGSKERAQQFDAALRQKDFYDMIFAQGDYAPVVVEKPLEPTLGTGDESGGDLYDPYSIQPFKR
jgi:predicted phage terminase large subunit-like protein